MASQPDDLARLLTAELGPGEHILWSERPDPSVAMLSNWPIVLFALLWLLISSGGVVAALRDGHATALAFMAIFVAIGLYMLFSPVLEYLDARGTIFGISERRLIVVRRNGRSIKSTLLAGVRQVERIRKSRGVTLRIPTMLVSDGDGGQKVNYLDLHGLKDGERAYRLLVGNSQLKV